jgi:hypothetical protein
MRLREWINEYFSRLGSPLSARRGKRHLSSGTNSYLFCFASGSSNLSVRRS